MTKYSFLNELDQLLSGLPLEERKEILEDYEEHFAFAKRADKSDEDIIALVGTPAEVAKEILEQHGQEGQFDARNERKLQEEAAAELEKQAAELEAQAAALEAKLAEQAEALAQQAEALAQQAETYASQEDSFKGFKDNLKDNFKNFGENFGENFDESFGSKVGNFVDSIVATVGPAVENLTEITIDDAESMPEGAIQSESLIEEIVDVTGVRNVIINARNQKVSIEPTDESKATVSLAKGMLAVKVEGDTLYVESRALKRKFSVGFFQMNADAGSNLSVELPNQVYDLIQAKSANAVIEIEDFEVSQLDLESSNGKLHVEDVQANEIKLRTGNGQIYVEDVRGDLVAKTTNGKISLTEFEGSINATTSNGKIELEEIKGSGDIEAKTSNGKIEFRNETINQNVKLTTANAGITVTLDQKPENATFELSTSNAKTNLFDTDRNYDVFGDGTYQVKLVTSNGRIDVETD